MDHFAKYIPLTFLATLAACGGGEPESTASPPQTGSAPVPVTQQGIAAESLVAEGTAASPQPQSLAAAATPARVISRTDNRPIPPTYFGMHFHRADGQTVWPSVPIGSWRLWDAEATWKYLEPTKGTWDWAKLDGYVATARQRNVQLTLPLALTPRWASARPNESSAYGSGHAAEPADLADWRNYVRTVATRYKGKIFFYEIWNEVNERAFFSGTPDKIVELTREARQVLKAVDPRIKLTGPAAIGDHTGAYDYFNTLLAKGIHTHVDALAYHLYVHSHNPEVIVDVVDNLRTRMAANNVSLPLWNTETGWWIANQDGTPATFDGPEWKHLDQRLAAGYVVRSFVLSWALGIEQFFWYSWDNTTMGLVEPTRRTMKLGGAAYGNMVTLLTGATLSQCALTAPLWTCDLTTKAGKQAKIIWSQNDQEVSTALPTGWTTDTSIHYFEQSAKPVRFNQADLRAGIIPRMIVKD